MPKMMWNYGTPPSPSRYEMATIKDPIVEAALKFLSTSCVEHSGPGFGFQFAHDSYRYCQNERTSAGSRDAYRPDVQVLWCTLIIKIWYETSISDHFLLHFKSGLQRAIKILQTCVWLGSRTWQESTLRGETMLKLPTVWSTVQHWLQNTSTCWRIVATCQLVVSHFRSVFSD